MPELPEIETVKLQLGKVLPGQKLVKVIVNSNKIVRGELTKLVGLKVVGIERKGKVLLIDFGSDQKLGFHFKMTGQLVYEPLSTKYSVLSTQERIVGGHPTEDFVKQMPSAHTRVIFEFDNGKLYFNDQRLFGWIELNPKFVENLGPEPFVMTPDEFSGRMGKTRKPIKLAIMDQAMVAGVGNIYANDALWEAGIRPDKPANSCTVEQLHSLLEKLKLVLEEGIKYGGATAENYVNLHGMGGHYQDHFRVYAREGEPCWRKDGGRIEKIVLGGRGTYYCPVCQK